MSQIPDAFGVDFVVMRDGHFVTVRRRGRRFVIGDRDVKLFEIRVMAEAIDRTTRTITDWERAGWWPKAMYSVTGTRCKHWYSERQIKHANTAWLRHASKGKSKHFDRETFFREIRNGFYAVEENQDG